MAAQDTLKILGKTGFNMTKAELFKEDKIKGKG